MEQLKDKLKKLDQFKYPLLILILGVMLMLLPSGRGTKAEAAADENTLLQQMLSSSEGVGQARVIVSENGVVVVCYGADDAKVRLDVIKAVSAYTGFGADRITILKMADERSHVRGGDA